MNKTCLICRSSFAVTQRELDFLGRNSPAFNGQQYLIPPPALCPVCRNKQRMAWRNDRTFYRRTCDLTGEAFISLYASDTPFPVYETQAWLSDSWNPLDYGRDFDFSKSFFEQWRELMLAVPRLGLTVFNSENSNYCSYCADAKNCYLDIAGEANEDCHYNLYTKYSKDCVDCTFVYHSTLCYESINCYNSYQVQYSQYAEHCSDCYFCFDLKGCKNCLFSSNLRNKEYYIFNEKVSPKEFARQKAALELTSRVQLEKIHQRWQNNLANQATIRDMYLLNCENCIGNNIQNSKNCSFAFNVTNCEDCSYIYDVMDAKDVLDANYTLYNPEASYQFISALQLRYSMFCMFSHYSSNLLYCDLCKNSHNLFGCIGLDRKEYCVLNKQYEKREYEELASRIAEHMKETGEWGVFFPTEYSPHGYNETIAMEYYPLTEQDAKQEGYVYRVPEEKTAPGVLSSVPDSLKGLGEAAEAFACGSCRKAFRFIPQEINFYQINELAPPGDCPDCRHKARTKRRTPRQLFQRKCAQCAKDTYSAYSETACSKVHCEECYLKFIQ